MRGENSKAVGIAETNEERVGAGERQFISVEILYIQPQKNTSIMLSFRSLIMPFTATG